MNNYIALLRGINVGGKNLIKMEDLRKEFESLGFKSIKTYIQSGNVIFQTDLTDRKKMEDKIEKALVAKFRNEIKAFVRSQKDIEKIISNFPEIFNDPKWKHNIIFLGGDIDSKNILKKFQPKGDIEQNYYYKGVLFWSAKMEGITRSSMLKLSRHEEYQEMTVRSINTVKKILEIMKDT